MLYIYFNVQSPLNPKIQSNSDRVIPLFLHSTTSLYLDIPYGIHYDENHLSRKDCFNLPITFRRVLLALLGSAILAFGLEWLMYDAMVVKVAEVDTLQLFSFVPFSQLLWPMVLTFSAAGLFVSIVGSWSSIRKFLDV
jgi:hypothetical protein